MTESVFQSWIDRAHASSLTDEEVAELAATLAASGEHLCPNRTAADLASTGGPASLSTLWAPAALVASGLAVAKVGVPGRPAGGIDVLAQVPGYRVNLDRPSAQAVLDNCGYVHILAGAQFAPADAAMFSYRQRVGAQAIPALAIASLLAKKLVSRTTLVGLEVRVAPHGNFGGNSEEARANARRFQRVAQLMDIKATCFLTDGTQPQQPYLGRGEALLGLSRLFSGRAGSWLHDHAVSCESWSSITAQTVPPSRLALAHAFASNLVAQGGSVDGLEERAADVAAAHSRFVTASRDGVVSYELGRLRDAILKARRPDGGLSFDDSVGLILLVKPGRVVREGEPLVSARCPEAEWPALRHSVLEALRLADPAEGGTAFPLAGALEVIGVGDG